jgi:hypothetical protein
MGFCSSSAVVVACGAAPYELAPNIVEAQYGSASFCNGVAVCAF